MVGQVDETLLQETASNNSGCFCFCEQNIIQFCPDRSGCTNMKCPQKRGKTWMEPRCVCGVQQLRRSCKMHTHQQLAKALFLASGLVKGTPSSTDTSSVFEPLSFRCHEVLYFTRNSTPIIERCLAQGTMATGMAFNFMLVLS